MHMQMKNNLSSCPPIILHNPDPISSHCIPNRMSNPLSNFKQISRFIFRNLIDVFVMFFGNHQVYALR